MTPGYLHLGDNSFNMALRAKLKRRREAIFFWAEVSGPDWATAVVACLVWGQANKGERVALTWGATRRCQVVGSKTPALEAYYDDTQVRPPAARKVRGGETNYCGW